MKRGERGFTVMEVLVALTVLLIGIGGILTLQISGLRASGYSRHAAEAAVVAEDRIELLRLASSVELVSGADVVNELGVPDSEGRYSRRWTVDRTGQIARIEVVVSWLERGSESHQVALRTQREVR